MITYKWFVFQSYNYFSNHFNFIFFDGKVLIREITQCGVITQQRVILVSIPMQQLSIDKSGGVSYTPGFDAVVHCCNG